MAGGGWWFLQGRTGGTQADMNNNNEKQQVAVAPTPAPLPDTKVAEVMSREVMYCYEDEDSAAVLRNMGDIQVRRLPVLNRDKRLIGIVSLADLVASGHTAKAGEALGGIVRPGGEHSQSIH